MKPLDLLETIDRQQLDLLRYLNDTEADSNKKNILAHLDIGEYFLKRILNQLKKLEKPAKNTFTIQTDKQTIRLTTKATFSIHGICRLLVAQSPKYVILENLFVDGYLKEEKICQKYRFGHTTYLQKIEELNHLLKEFDLTIHNNQLIGSELQIRLFFTTFFCTFNPPIHILNFKYNLQVQEAANKIQTVLETSFSEHNYKEDTLKIYLSIILKRYAQKNRICLSEDSNPSLNTINKKTQPAFVYLLKETEAFKDINTIVTELLVNYSPSLLPNEALFTFLFIIGNEMITENSKVDKEIHSIEQKVEGPTVNLCNSFINFLKTELLKTELTENNRSLLII